MAHSARGRQEPASTPASTKRRDAGAVWLRRALIAAAVSFVALFLLVPLFAVFAGALAAGVRAYCSALARAETVAALKLTLLAAAFAVSANLAFGLGAAWLLAKFHFRGKNLVITLIDLPLSISPVVAGLMFVLLFGRRAAFGSWLIGHGVRVLFAVPAVVLATLFVTIPFVAREVWPLMQAQGNDEEQAAMTLGAGPFRTLWSVTLPKVRWAVAYGVVLCSARAMGEYGAVSVVSGHILGVTTTLPLQAEILYHDYDAVGAFAVASLLALMSLFLLLLKKLVERRSAG